MGLPAIIDMGSRMRGEHNIRKRMELHSIHTCRANCTESEIIATTLGDRWIGSPRSRIAAMMQAAIGPFCFWGSMPKDHRRTNSDNKIERRGSFRAARDPTGTAQSRRETLLRADHPETSALHELL